MGKYDDYAKKLYGDAYTSKSKSSYERLYNLLSGKNTDLGKQQNKVNNIKARLEAGGVDPEEALDDRNAIEKFLNLDQDQGLIGDVLELLGRPQQSLFSGWKAAQEGGSFREGALKGLTGDEETQFKEILTNFGMKDEKGKLDVADILGFAGDVFLDPADLIPLAGFSKAAKVLDDTGDIFKAYKATDSLSDLAFKSAGKAIKGGAKVADKGIEKGLKYLDETQGVRNKAGDLVKLNYLDPSSKLASGLGKEALDGASDLTGTVGRLETYKGAKNTVENMFKLPEFVKSALGKSKKFNAEQEVSRIKLELEKQGKIDELQTYINSNVGKKGFKYDNVDDFLNDGVSLLEYAKNRTIENADLLKLGKSGKLLGYDEVVETLNNMVEKSVPDSVRKYYEGINPDAFKVTVDEKTGRIKLGSGFDKVSLDTSGTTTLAKHYSEEREKHILDILEDYKHNKNGYADAIDSVFGSIWKNAESDAEGVSKYVNVTTEPMTLYHGEDASRGVRTDFSQPGRGRFGDNNRLFLTDNKNVALSYTKGSTQGTTKLRIEKPNSKSGKTFKIDAKTSNWAAIPFSDDESAKAFKSIPENLLNKLADIRRNNYDSSDFIDAIRADKSIVEELKKYKIDISVDDVNPKYIDKARKYTQEGKRGYNNYQRGIYKNIDATRLDEIISTYIRSVPQGTYSQDYWNTLIDDKFLGKEVSTDFIADSITANNDSGRGQRYSVIEIDNVKDWASSAFVEDYSKTYNKDVILIDGKDRKLINPDVNRVPDFNSTDVADEFTNATYTPKPSFIDTSNRLIDQIQNGSNLATKYDMFTNSDYVIPHIKTEAAKKLSDAEMNIIRRGYTRGNSKLLSNRELLGSIDEINNYVKKTIDTIPEKELTPALKEFKASGSKLLEDSYIAAFDNRYLGKYGLTNNVKQTKMANEILIDSVFSEFDNQLSQINTLEKAGSDELRSAAQKALNKATEDTGLAILRSTNDVVPVGMRSVKNSEMIDYLDKFVKTNSQLGNTAHMNRIKDIIKNLKKTGYDVAVNEDIMRLISFSLDKSNFDGLAKLYGSSLNFYKKWKTSSPTFVLNAFLGNTSNLALSGISDVEQALLGPKVAKIMQNGQNLYTRKLAGEVLSAADNEIADLWFNFRKMGFDDAAFELANIPEELRDVITGKKPYKSIASKAVNLAPHINNIINKNLDTSARLMVMLKAMSDPSYINRLGVNSVEDAIAKVMFDPSMMTQFEKKYAKNFIPFYTYTKNNLVYHITNIQNNGSKYNQLMKGMKSLQESATGGEDENMADYLKSSLYIPIPALGENGDYTIIRATLPFGQIIETFENPVQTMVNSLGPIAKAPYEYATGIDSFTGRPIESFPGEKSSQIPFLTKKQQKLISDLSGLDVPLKVGSRMFEGIQEASQDDEGVLEGLRRGALNNLTIQGNVDTDRLNRSYEELDELETLMKQYEQEGYEFSTLNELKQANKNNTMASINAIFAKYGIE